MSNFYRDNSDILFHIKHMDFSRVVELKEDNFAERGKHPEAPDDLEDAVDNYDRVLEIVGEIAGEFVAPRARQVDKEGACLIDGEVVYAAGTAEAIDRLEKSELLGFTMPRKYGGLNIPKTVYSVAIELISRADVSLMNIFGLQEIADTIYKFGSQDQKDRYLPRFCSGEVMGSMALTEPDAGSDLQAVMLKADQDKDGKWYLNGVKRFITNGCAKISLVMARSEKNTTGGRGISLFIYERDNNMKIRRIEEKLGIHGSPTCELQFNNAEAELLGKRKFGLVKYTMSLMNGARLGIAAQSLGVAEAAYREANSYSKDRFQFKKSIREFAMVFEMLTDMKVNIEAARTLLYETSRIVDIKEGIEEKIENNPETKSDLNNDLKKFTRYSAIFTPIIKGYASEMANKICYDAIQIHAGVGFTCEFNVERLYRDARITSIYEGTTQLQVVAAIGGIMGGGISARLDEYEDMYDFQQVADPFNSARKLREYLEAAVDYIKEKSDPAYQEYHSCRVVEIATETLIGYLLCIDALKSERKKKVAGLFISKALHRIKSRLDAILSGDSDLIDFHKDVIDAGEVNL